MKTLKNRWIWLCGVILSLIGCNGLQSSRVEYGCPYADFNLEGIVVDEDDKPLEGVVVSHYHYEQVTDKDGRFEYFNYWMGVNDTLQLNVYPPSRFYDPVTGYVVHVEQTKPGDGHWYEGEFQTVGDVRIVLPGAATIIPEYTYRVRGKVLDSSNNPVEGIVVSQGEENTASGKDGSFEFITRSLELMDRLVLEFSDIDGALNGGSFESRSKTLILSRLEDGDGAWDGGVIGADNVEVRLTRVGED